MVQTIEAIYSSQSIPSPVEGVAVRPPHPLSSDAIIRLLANCRRSAAGIRKNTRCEEELPPTANAEGGGKRGTGRELGPSP
jgi:hypothetical protein